MPYTRKLPIAQNNVREASGFEAGNQPAVKSVRDGAVYKQRTGKSQLATSHNGCHFMLLLLTLLARLTIPLAS